MKPLRCTATVLFLFVIAQSAWSQEPRVTTMPLWPGGPPEENGLTGEDKSGNWGCISNISTATLTVHLPEPDKANGMAVVITPGGGYAVVCAETEGKQIADLLVPRGTAAIVLKYRLPNQHHLIPSSDARHAIRTVREYAKEWNIDPNKVGVWGFSAGGHLASTVSTAFDAGKADSDDSIEKQSCRPNFSILFYPVVSMEQGVTHNGSRGNLLGPDPTEELVKRYSNAQQVSKETPPTFLLHAADDTVVKLENSLAYYKQLVAHGVSARLMVYETGGHGPTAFKNNPTWLPVFEDWLSKR